MIPTLKRVEDYYFVEHHVYLDEYHECECNENNSCLDNLLKELNDTNYTRVANGQGYRPEEIMFEIFKYTI